MKRLASTEDCVERVDDAVVRTLHGKVKELKKSRILEEKYMTVEELMRKEYAKGKADMLELASCMIADGKADEVARLADDSKFLEEMLKKYKLD